MKRSLWKENIGGNNYTVRLIYIEMRTRGREKMERVTIKIFAYI